MSSNFGNDKDYNPGRDASFVAETGAVSNNREATNVDFRREDREAAESESSGRIPQSMLSYLCIDTLELIVLLTIYFFR